MGICIWSPRLDDRGNSQRGIRFFSKMIEKYSLSIFDQLFSGRKKFNETYMVMNWYIILFFQQNLKSTQHFLMVLKQKTTPYHRNSSDNSSKNDKMNVPSFTSFMIYLMEMITP
jgi:hypothetical protein